MYQPVVHYWWGRWGNRRVWVDYRNIDGANCSVSTFYCENCIDSRGRLWTILRCSVVGPNRIKPSGTEPFPSRLLNTFGETALLVVAPPFGPNKGTEGKQPRMATPRSISNYKTVKVATYEAYLETLTVFVWWAEVRQPSKVGI
jgi:hypothetical protein